MVNSLVTDVGLKMGPVVLGTFVKHFLDNLKEDHRDGEGSTTTQLHLDELMYHEVFNIAKVRAVPPSINREIADTTVHTVEEIQAFSNTPTPSPPWVHVVRTIIPMSCCNDAAQILIRVLGGPDTCRRLIGGVKWWQVRGIHGMDAQWIAAKRDYKEAKRQYKMREEELNSATSNNADAQNSVYEKDMDEMRCILYSHGGGYYFGSVDQERYSIQRYARKINGRVLAVNYRLSPQYPFPCAIQDLLAAYLFLIRPPPEALHRPVDPAHIVIAGDSAGGGLSLALLQVLRDAELPMPAGGVLISPWCDLTHSFPSIHTNTATDVIPDYGLSVQKPSALWPPPPAELTSKVHATLRTRVRQVFHVDNPISRTWSKETKEKSLPPLGRDLKNEDLGKTVSCPPIELGKTEKIILTASDNETLEIDSQIHLYTVNSLITHPLVSPALSYLGGLPPLFFIAGDKEVLTDEIIYTAHRAAHPEKYPVKDSVVDLYPPLYDISSRGYKPTRVHLQVYDDCAHVLPVLFSFSTPAKYCYRAMATFCKYVTGLPPTTYPRPTHSLSLSPRKRQLRSGEATDGSKKPADEGLPNSGESRPRYSTMRKSASLHIRRHPKSEHYHRPDTADKKGPEILVVPTIPILPSPSNSVILSESPVESPAAEEPPMPGIGEVERTAGNPAVYGGVAVSLKVQNLQPWNGEFIGERISTRGVVRPLEDGADIPALHVPPDHIGVLNELTIKRYLDGLIKFEKRFSRTIREIERERRKNLERAKKDDLPDASVICQSVPMDDTGEDCAARLRKGLIPTSGSWSWAWILDEHEIPPPSSIVSRRDTAEARELALVADQAAVPQRETILNANTLWGILVGALTTSKEKKFPGPVDSPVRPGTPEGEKSKLSTFISRIRRPHEGKARSKS
ncbi:alpha/beta-hydrolase [Fistulina hepatica ATCC 64428]|uniref:Alpha/beta-hydrolase n=1 Tax=Fistulina hepatica ATCC 64428 TaxID=1128425 RepID=A0A0D7A732_9AGAR|nr:alpha/beta-hydrolase [Fistulina hepatica ATCC 64428]